MNKKVTIRLVLVMILALVLGFFAGFSTHRNLVDKRMEKVKRLDKPQRLSHRIIDIIDANDSQADSIHAIVQQRMGAISSERKLHAKKSRADMRMMFQELEGQMDSAQVKRFRKAQKRWMHKRRKARRSKKNRGPKE